MARAQRLAVSGGFTHVRVGLPAVRSYFPVCPERPTHHAGSLLSRLVRTRFLALGPTYGRTTLAARQARNTCP
jgi:hypothetical protein